jgi:hypothetical protein
MRIFIACLGMALFIAACGHKSQYPSKPGLVYSSVATNNPNNTNLLSFVDTSGKKEINIKFSYTVNLNKVPSNGVVLKSITLIDAIGNHPDRSDVQDLPAVPSGTKAEDAEDGTLQVTINAKQWYKHVTTPGTLDSVRYRAVITDYADRTSDTVEVPVVFLQY